MMYTVEWDNPEKTVLRITLHPGWTWDDHYLGVDAAKSLLLSVNHPVDFIVDQRGTKLPPNAMVHGRKLITDDIPNRRMTVHVGADPVMVQIIDVGKKTFPEILKKFNYALADTVEEAREIIRQQQ